jgi:hypothetical protein
VLKVQVHRVIKVIPAQLELKVLKVLKVQVHKVTKVIPVFKVLKVQ